MKSPQARSISRSHAPLNQSTDLTKQEPFDDDV